MNERELLEQLGSGLWELAPMATRERAERLDRSLWAKDFEWADLKRLAVYTAAIRLGNGGLLFQEADRQAFMCLILEGRLKIRKNGTGASGFEVAELGPGDSIGEMSLFDQQPRSASVVAMSDCILLLLSRARLVEMKSKEPELASTLIWQLARLLSQRLRRTSGLLVAK